MVQQSRKIPLIQDARHDFPKAYRQMAQIDRPDAANPGARIRRARCLRSRSPARVLSQQPVSQNLRADLLRARAA
jgi:hypothetical protein